MIKYDHPVLEPILKETYGVILYQEQVMRISREFANFSPGQADVLRKAMGKKSRRRSKNCVDFLWKAPKPRNQDQNCASGI